MSELKPLTWAYMPSPRPRLHRRFAERVLDHASRALIVFATAIPLGIILATVVGLLTGAAGCGAC